MTAAFPEPQEWRGEEHRAHVRVRAALRATCAAIRPDATLGAKFPATTLDLSVGGVALRTPRGVLPSLDLSAGGFGPRPPRGVPPPVLVALHLAGDAPPLNVDVAGTVVRLAIVDDSVVLGVRFNHLDAATRRTLTIFVFSEAARTGAYTSPVRQHGGDAPGWVMCSSRHWER
jgi:c-di-GMP-binding flagellar brake protein YcgR